MYIPIFCYVILFRLLVNLWFVERMIIRKLWENDWPLTINKRLLFWTFIGNDDYLERLMLHLIPQPYLREFPRSLRTWKVSTFYLEITCTRAWLCKLFSRLQGTTMKCLVNSLPKFDPIVNDNVLLHSQKVAFHKRKLKILLPSFDYRWWCVPSFLILEASSKVVSRQLNVFL